MTENEKESESEREEDVEEHFDLFKKTVNWEKHPVLTILQVHLLTEHYLVRALQVLLPRSDRIISELGYYQKVLLVSSFDVVKDKTIQCLKGLNSLRNKCSHEFEKKISFSEIGSLASPLGQKCTKFRRQSAGSPEAFLVLILAYLSGGLARQIAALEDAALKKAHTKDKSA